MTDPRIKLAKRVEHLTDVDIMGTPHDFAASIINEAIDEAVRREATKTRIRMVRKLNVMEELEITPFEVGDTVSVCGYLSQLDKGKVGYSNGELMEVVELDGDVVGLHRKGHRRIYHVHYKQCELNTPKELREYYI